MKPGRLVKRSGFSVFGKCGVFVISPEFVLLLWGASERMAKLLPIEFFLKTMPALTLLSLEDCI